MLRNQDFGPLAIAPEGSPDLIASGEIFSNATGNTYWVEAEAPFGNIFAAGSPIGSESLLMQTQTFRKRRDDATLRLVISQALLDANDYNGSLGTSTLCPWATTNEWYDYCLDYVLGELTMDVRIVEITPRPNPNVRHQHFNGGVRLHGFAGAWRWEPFTDPNPIRYGDILLPGSAPRAIFSRPQFELLTHEISVFRASEKALLTLRAPIVLNVDLSAMPLDAEFGVWVEVRAMTHNRRARESYIRTRLRDPVSSSGTALETTGLEATSTRLTNEPPSVESAAPACFASSVASGAAGTLQFSAPTYFIGEFGGPAERILVTREGGSEGTVIATVTTSPGTAVAGVNYQPVERQAVFYPGDDTPRSIAIPLIDDPQAGGHRTVDLHLTATPDCAVIGTQSDAVLTIIDDEYRPPVDVYSVGGTVMGLDGTGLVLEEVITGTRVTPTNGPFTLDREFSQDDSYDVRVITQPTSPAQTCTLANGTGTVSANVTDIAVTCVTPQPSATLDTTFGDGGRVFADMPGGGRALALQSDGKILALGRSRLMRFNTNGTVDTTFGTAGTVAIAFNGVSGEEARDLAVQSDGRIVVAGYTRATPTVLNYDFAVARYNSNGQLDTSLGGDGVVAIDFDGQLDRGHRVALLSDGRILIGGHAGFIDPAQPGVVQQSFAVTRLDANGALDTTFGTDPPFTGTGKRTMLSGSSLALAMAVGPDGKILLGGRVGSDGADPPAAGLARWSANGVADTDTDSDPTVYLGLNGSGSGTASLSDFDVIEDLLITQDGTIFGAMNNTLFGRPRFMLVQFATPFGLQVNRPPPFQITDVPIGPNDDVVTSLTQQADGKFIVAGSASSAATVSDFGIVRFNADRSVDTAFGNNGVLLVDFFGSADGASDVIVQSDGRILALGSARNDSTVGLGLLRILP